MKISRTWVLLIICNVVVIIFLVLIKAYSTIIWVFAATTFYYLSTLPQTHSRNDENGIHNSLYNHKLWLSRIKNQHFSSIEVIPFVNLITIQRSLSTPTFGSKTFPEIVTLLEQHLLNINDLEYEIQILKIKENISLEDFLKKENIKRRIEKTESNLDQTIIYFEYIIEQGKLFHSYRFNHKMKSPQYYKIKINQKLKEISNKEIEITSNEFICINCTRVFVGIICPECNSKLKKNTIKIVK